MGLVTKLTHMRNIQTRIVATGICLFLSACEKSRIEPAETYVEPSEYRVGHYVGMFQECGTTICYDKDTSFDVVKSGGKYYLQFGNHFDEIAYWTPAAVDFHSVETSALISGPLFGGYCRNDSFFAVFTTAWGVYNNNLLSGKKQ